MVNEGDGVARRGTDRPAPTEEIHLMVGVDAASEVQRQMKIQQRGIRAGTHDGALLCLGFGASVVRGETGGAADGPVLTGQLAGQQFLGGGVTGDLLEGQQGDEAVLEGAKAAFDFAFGLRAGRDQVRDAQGGEGALELRTGIAVVARGLMAKQGQAIGVDRHRQAVQGERAAKVLEVVPGGVGGDEGGGHEFAGVVIHGQQEGLFIFIRPPLVDGGIMLPQFAQAGAFPAAAGLGQGRGRADQQREVSAGVSGDGFAVADEGEAGGQFVGDELIVGRPLERQEGLQKLPDLGGPGGAMVAAGEAEGEGGGLPQPGGAQAEEVGPADAQELGGGVRVQVAAVESVERLVEELEGEAIGELMFCKRPLIGGAVGRARLFVGLRFAPASSKPGPANERFPLSWEAAPPVSFCSHIKSPFVPAPTGSMILVDQHRQRPFGLIEWWALLAAFLPVTLGTLLSVWAVRALFLMSGV